MNKSELVEKTAEEAGSTQAEAARHLEAMIEVVTETLKAGDEVRITGFGKFYADGRKQSRSRSQSSASTPNA